MDNRKIICILIFLNIFSFSCSNGNKKIHSDEFYMYSSGGDYKRLPLIKPYVAINSDGQTWVINLSEHSKLGQFSFSNVKKVGLCKDYFFAYCSDSTIFHGNVVKEAWFVVNPLLKIETGFIKKDEFDSCLNKLKMNYIYLYNIDSVWDKFNETNYLPFKHDSDIH